MDIKKLTLAFLALSCSFLLSQSVLAGTPATSERSTGPVPSGGGTWECCGTVCYNGQCHQECGDCSP